MMGFEDWADCFGQPNMAQGSSRGLQCQVLADDLWNQLNPSGCHDRRSDGSAINFQIRDNDSGRVQASL